MSRRHKILHVITGLGAGGAQSGLLELIRHTPELDHRVMTLKEEHPYGPKIRELGVPVSTSKSISHFLRTDGTDWVHCWLYHADLIGGLLGRATGRRVLWHLHVSALEPSGSKRTTRWVARRCAELSRTIPEHIVACSVAAAEAHAALGYRRSSIRVIENGVDLSRFRPGDSYAARTRLGIPQRRFTVGIVARFDPQKDIKTALVAFARLQRDIDAQLVLVGQDMDEENAELSVWIDELKIRPRVFLLGVQDPMEHVYPAFDVFSLSSVSEALSMSLLESMACGLVPVVTDVGETRRVVGDIGAVVPIQDPNSLANEWRALATTSRKRLAELARSRVAARYSVKLQADRFRALYARPKSAGSIGCE